MDPSNLEPEDHERPQDSLPVVTQDENSQEHPSHAPAPGPLAREIQIRLSTGQDLQILFDPSSQPISRLIRELSRILQEQQQQKEKLKSPQRIQLFFLGKRLDLQSKLSDLLYFDPEKSWIQAMVFFED